MINQIWQDFLNQLNTNQFLSGGVILGAITGILVYLKSFPRYVWERIVRLINYEITIEANSKLYEYLQQYLNYKYKNKMRNILASYRRSSDNMLGFNEGVNTYYNKENEYYGENESALEANINNKDSNNPKNGKVVFDHRSDFFRIFYKKRIIKIEKDREKINTTASVKHLYFDSYTISGLFGKKAILELIEEILKYNTEIYNKDIKSKIYKNNSYRWTESPGKLRNINNIFIDPIQKERILNDIQNFINHKNFYNLKNILYRRGYLFYGPPGTGKTSLISALANYFKRNLYILNLKNVDKEVLDDLFDSMDSNSIVLIEDIDAYFKGRDSNSTDLSFSDFINIISGVNTREDIILMITTNKKSELDEALIRSGRFDLHLEISYPSIKEINEFLTFFYDTNITLKEEDIKTGTTIADIENICIEHKYDKDEALKILKK